MTTYNPSRPYLTIRQVCERFSTSRETVRLAIQEGRLDGWQVGGRGPWRVDPDDATRWAEGT